MLLLDPDTIFAGKIGLSRCLSAPNAPWRRQGWTELQARTQPSHYNFRATVLVERALSAGGGVNTNACRQLPKLGQNVLAARGLSLARGVHFLTFDASLTSSPNFDTCATSARRPRFAVNLREAKFNLVGNSIMRWPHWYVIGFRQ
jgi:hypothetical protein